MIAVLACITRRFADVLVCMICGVVGHTEDERGHLWDFHAGERAA